MWTLDKNLIMDESGSPICELDMMNCTIMQANIILHANESMTALEEAIGYLANVGKLERERIDREYTWKFPLDKLINTLNKVKGGSDVS